MNIKLGELCIIQAGGTPSRSNQEYWNNGEIPWVKIGDIESKYLIKTSEFITNEGLKNSSAKKIERGSILYTIFATLGEVCITKIDVTTNQAIAGISLKDDKVYIDYLYYFLKSLKNHVNAIGRGVAQNNINLTLLKGFEVPIPEKSRQLIIAQTLSNVEKIIESKKKQLIDYDQLIKSRFVEMFGNEKNEVNLEKVCIGITDGSHNPPKGIEYSEYIMLSSKNINDRKISLADPRYLTVEDFQNENRRTQIQTGDVLLTIVGTIGRTAVVPDNFNNLTLQRSVAVLHPNTKTITPTFLEQSLCYIQHLIEAEANGVAQKGIYLNQVRKLQIKLANLEKQIEYTRFVEQIDKLKFLVQKSLNETQTFFDSLMQKYFG